MPTERVDINDIARLGVVKGVPGFQLPPEAWTGGTNIRYRDEAVESVGGRKQVFGTPSGAPYFAMVLTLPTQVWWIYTSLTAAFITDGVAHHDITKSAATYSASSAADWNGTIHNGVAVINNGADVPQQWAGPDESVLFADLANWPSTLRAKVIRSIGPYMVALHLTDDGTVKPHTVQWSHPSDPGAVPISWDHTDPTVDAGQNDLPDVNSGLLVDAQPLRGSLYLYKQGSVWRMRPIGGRHIFDFEPILETVGALGTRCVAILGDGARQCFATQDDLIVHDGQQARSVLSRRYRRYLANLLDPSAAENAFLFANPLLEEIWFCFPEIGSSLPTRALVWNYGSGLPGQLSEAEVDFQWAAVGEVAEEDPETWDSTTGTWDDAVGPWAAAERQRVLLCDPVNTKLLLLDEGTDFDGQSFTAQVQREGLAIAGKKRDGSPIVDFAVRKMVTRVWLKLEDGPVNVRVGFQDTVSGQISWTTSVVFDPATQMYIDVVGSGRAVAIELSSTNAWRLLGYSLEVAPGGAF